MRRVAGLCLLSVLAAGCAAFDRALVIGAVYPTGGGQGSGGVEEFRGVTLAAAYVNGRGGIRGRPVRLHLEAADSSDAAPFAVERLSRAGVTVIVGSYGSTISLPAAETASRRGLFFWETGAVGSLSMETARGTRVFRFAPTGEALGRAAVAFVRDQIAPRAGRAGLRYTVVFVDDVYGRPVAEGALAEIRKSGLRLAAVLPYDLRQVDYARLARRVAEARTDVLVVSAYLRDGIALRRALVRANVPLVASIGTSSSYCMPEFGAALGADAVGLFASDKPDGDVVRTEPLSEEAEAALRWGRGQYRSRFHDSMTAAALSGFSGGLALFGHVLAQAPGLSPESVAQAALATHLPSGSLPNGSGLAFAPAGHPHAGDNLRASSVIWEWIRPGVRAVVWPPAFATHPIRFR